MKFDLTMITPSGKQESNQIERISLPTEDGIRTVLANHMDIIVPVAIGTITLINDSERKHYAVSEGLFYFKDNQAKLLVRTFEHPEEIDFKRAEEAKERAQQRLNHKEQMSTDDLRRAELALKRALARLSLR
ncbi:ATP synthase F1 subunit epsilon [Eremococcus coleocola]|uniref:ATP synthase epsilon chain n=1 Tax=Eremococcus coleocola ACS-139-V-Col8 TaxID=908337 RepID=E4KQR6_9LACT|nr:ATP synthase F1 subunit epsilon [Eremococcus coleocola]EFR30625.1 ATP synthase F1, epsilon subunit [Eremococcus coleocola ACS-139-V-Col8]